MSEENPHKPEEQSIERAEGAAELQEIESLNLSINKATNEILVRDATGKIVLELKQPLSARPQATETKEEERKSLTANEFRSVFERLDNLGITWTADIPPLPTIKEKGKGQFSSEEYNLIQKEYPRFPRELTALIFHALIGSRFSEDLIGTEEAVREKVAVLNEKLITPQYRSDFFFRYAIKVPYFENIDWEVVIKAYERGVKDMPKTPYVLLNLILRNPIDITIPLTHAVNEDREPEFITVAANENLLDSLIEHLTEARLALEKAKRLDLKEPNTLQEGQDNGSS